MADISLTAEIIAIGDELNSGVRVDTNSSWLSRRLTELGVRVLFHSTVGDDLLTCSQVFKQAARRVDIVVSTGGLGPTADDLTRQALSAAAKAPLQLDPASLKKIRQIFSQRGRPMPQRNQVQAMFPAGSRVVPNPHGTAPGIDLSLPVEVHADEVHTDEVHADEDRVCRVFCLPGVPAEMKQMWRETVVGELKSIGAGHQVTQHHLIRCFGIGESDCEERLPDLIRRGREPTVGITVHRATITLRVSTTGSSHADCQAAMQPTIELIHQSLGSVVFGQADEQLQDVVAGQLQQRGETLATVEWGTPGVMTHWLRQATDDLSPRPFLAGVTANRWQSMATLLPAFPAMEKGPRDDQAIVSHLAEAIRQQLGATYGLAVGPCRREDSADPPTRLLVGLASDQGTEIQSTGLVGHPDIVDERNAKFALNFLRLKLLA